MKLLLIMVGKTDNPPYNRLINDYADRIAHYIPFEQIVIPDIRKTENLAPSIRRDKEGELILRALRPGDCCILLDEKGREYTSVEFSEFIGKHINAGSKRLAFVVGGPYGFGQKVYAAAAGMVSLSRMTFSHQMVRLIFIEQAYRAMTILKNEGYHHG
ncbi:MAG: 23S rRNA (pseudouridine(1915)-N(3))-methyltransferase RlmH [Tannerellaceae bacterium]|jgi:23S rRNA (pseudouridine1915-N3)-methyltransferase|nr:23S rRNA (pseudouridine(1915)-N(3))-methyltransferase RlmH [Tannerellaceae bacterium]